MHPLPRRAAALLFAAALLAPAHAQDHGVAGTDVRLGILNSLDHFGRDAGTGLNAFAMGTTICNVGTNTVPWLAPMNSDHPMIGFMIARELGGRMEQISNRSYVKHGFLALASSQCTPCTPPPGGGNELGLGCSDTYGAGTNASNFWLGPPDEIDAFHGAWDPVCSLFDLGLAGTVCDGNRSYDGTGLGPLGNRVKVHDSDLALPGATYWFQAYYVVKQELEAVRHNNFHSRRFSATFNGSGYSVSEAPQEVEPNRSVLERWIEGPDPADLVIEGLSSQANLVGTSTLDGRVYVAYQVTEPSPGVFHYEYAVHNRDNARGVGRFELPLCPGASISNFGSSDTTSSSADDWTASVSPDDTTLVFEDAGGTNAVRWNNLFNFWFDSNAAPGFRNGTLVAAHPGPGNDSFTVKLFAPADVCQAALVPYGCAANDGEMTVTGTPGLGQAVEYELDNPALTQSAGVGVLNIGVDAPALYPCGVNVPILGGEFLLGATILEPILYPGAWTPGNPVSFTLDIPVNPALAGQSLYNQSFLVEVGPLNIKPSEGVRMVVGP